MMEEELSVAGQVLMVGKLNYWKMGVIKSCWIVLQLYSKNKDNTYRNRDVFLFRTNVIWSVQDSLQFGNKKLNVILGK